MKKILLLIVALCASASAVLAQNALVVDAVNLPKVGEADLAVKFQLKEEAEGLCAGYQFNIKLPEGIEFVTKANGNVEYTSGDCYDEDGAPSYQINIDEGILYVGCTTAGANPILGTSGTLIIFKIKATDEFYAGEEKTATLGGAVFSLNAAVPIDDVDFTINIVERASVTLDENSTIVPSAATNVDVTVKRIIKANEWSTIVLPFAMDADMVKEAFGDDVQLADFTGYDSEEDDDENIVGLTLNFETCTDIEANHPYVIKVSEAISEFTAEAVDLEPEEDDACIEEDNGRTGARRVVYHGFYGTYHAGTEIPELNLFLSENKFWYSAGETTMKAYRAYFYLGEFLTSAEDKLEGAAKIRFSISDGATGIAAPGVAQSAKGVYTLQGVSLGAKNVQSLPKGIYIVDGKKVSVK